MAASALSLNRQVYEALTAIDLEDASPATRHYVERTLLSYRLAGVDKDEATRARLQSLHEKATRLSLEFGRNIQEGAKTIEATPVELAGLPEDFIARHPAQKCAKRNARYADYRSAGDAAGDDLCLKRRAARTDVRRLQHARLPGQSPDPA
jgi:Zn-dependent oligopeptidase